MKCYVIATGLAFGLIVVAHILRIYAEGTGKLSDPGFVIATILAFIFFGWALVLLLKNKKC